MDRKMIGARIVAGILPFFKFMFVANIVAVAIAAILQFRLTIFHVLIYPMALAIVYSVYETERKVKQATH